MNSAALRSLKHEWVVCCLEPRAVQDISLLFLVCSSSTG